MLWQIPTPEASLVDLPELIGQAWPLVFVFLAMFAPIFAVLIARTISGWVGAVILHFAESEGSSEKFSMSDWSDADDRDFGDGYYTARWRRRHGKR